MTLMQWKSSSADGICRYGRVTRTRNCHEQLYLGRERLLCFRGYYSFHMSFSICLCTKTAFVIYISQYFGPAFSFLSQSFSRTAVAWLLWGWMWLQSECALTLLTWRACSALVTGFVFYPFLRRVLRRWRHADSSRNKLSELLDSLKNRLLCSLLLTPSFLNNSEMWGKNNALYAETMRWDITIGKGIKFNWTLQSKPGAYLCFKPVKAFSLQLNRSAFDSPCCYFDAQLTTHRIIWILFCSINFSFSLFHMY